MADRHSRDPRLAEADSRLNRGDHDHAYELRARTLLDRLPAQPANR